MKTKIIKYLDYSLASLADFLSLSSFRFYRAYKGGIWYKHEMTGELPGCYGSWWSQDPKHHFRYVSIVAKEVYNES